MSVIVLTLYKHKRCINIIYIWHVTLWQEMSLVRLSMDIHSHLLNKSPSHVIQIKYDIWGRTKYPWGLPSLTEATNHPSCLYTVYERLGAWMEIVCPVLMRGSPTYPCTKGLPKSCSFSCHTEKCLQSVSPCALGSRWWPGLLWPFIWAMPMFVPDTLKRAL